MRLKLRDITRIIAARDPGTALSFALYDHRDDIDLMVYWHEHRREQHRQIATINGSGDMGAKIAYHTWLGGLLRIWHDKSLTVKATFAHHDARHGIDLRTGETSTPRGNFTQIYTIAKREVCMRANGRFTTQAEMDQWVALWKSQYARVIKSMDAITLSGDAILFCDISRGSPPEAVAMVTRRSILERRKILAKA